MSKAPLYRGVYVIPLYIDLKIGCGYCKHAKQCKVIDKDINAAAEGCKEFTHFNPDQDTKIKQTPLGLIALSAKNKTRRGKYIKKQKQSNTGL